MIPSCACVFTVRKQEVIQGREQSAPWSNQDNAAHSYLKGVLPAGRRPQKCVELHVRKILGERHGFAALLAPSSTSRGSRAIVRRARKPCCAGGGQQRRHPRKKKFPDRVVPFSARARCPPFFESAATAAAATPTVVAKRGHCFRGSSFNLGDAAWKLVGVFQTGIEGAFAVQSEATPSRRAHLQSYADARERGFHQRFTGW